jgi:hypothetical protein
MVPSTYIVTPQFLRCLGGLHTLHNDPLIVHSVAVTILGMLRPYTLCSCTETVFLNFKGAQESIPPAYVAWRASTPSPGS